MANNSKNQGASEDTRTIVTVLLLIFFPLVGLVLMWAWTNWKKWVKWLITAIFIFWTVLTIVLVGIFVAAVLVTVDPAGQLEKAEKATELNVCIQSCIQQLQVTQGANFDQNTAVSTCRDTCLVPSGSGQNSAPMAQ